jgi:hypothetical protein
VAHPAGGDVDDHLTRTGIGDDDVNQLDGLLLAPGDHAADCLTHGYNLREDVFRKRRPHEK